MQLCKYLIPLLIASGLLCTTYAASAALDVVDIEELLQESDDVGRMLLQTTGMTLLKWYDLTVSDALQRNAIQLASRFAFGANLSTRQKLRTMHACSCIACQYEARGIIRE